MEASGGYERDAARALVRGRHRSADRRSERVRGFARSAGRLAKNDAIDAETIAWFAEIFREAPAPICAAREKLVQAGR